MKRVLSLLVVLAMVIAMVPNVFAAKDEIEFDELLGKLTVLEDISEIPVSLGEGAASKAYKWTPDADGTLTMYIYDVLPEDVTVSMAQGDNSATYDPDSTFELAVIAGESVTIRIAKTDGEALNFTMSGVVSAPSGTEENPYALMELQTTVTVTTAPMWFQGFFNGTTMTVAGAGDFTVTANGEPAAAVEGVVTMDVVTPNPRMPFVFTIDNVGEYTITFEYPLGTQMNPEVLFRPAYIAVNIAEGNDQGYYYKWYSNADGTLQLTCPAVEGVEYDVILTNMSSYETAWLQDSTDGTVSIDVKSGDEVQIQVSTIPNMETWTYPALETALTGEFLYPVGTQMNPEVLFRPAYIAVNIAEGNDQGYYYKWYSNADGALKLTCPAVEGVEYDVILTNMSSYETAWLQDSTDGTVSIDVKSGDEVIIQVVTAPDADWNYPALETALTGEFVFPVGTQMNPEVLFRPQYIAVNVAEGNRQGYYYKWTSSASGTLKLTCPAVEGVEYDVVLTNLSTYANAWLQDSTDGTVSMDVKPGDEIIIQVVTAPDANWNYPALETALTGEIIFPVGDQMNPAQLVIGENAAEIAAGSQGYFYTWTAEASGNLTITMPEGNWYYVVNNITAGIYGDAQWSDSDPVCGTYTIKVSEGDEIQVVINTYDPADEFNAPAGKLVITAAFGEVTYDVGNLNGDDVINEDDAIYLLQHVMMPDLFKVDQPVDYNKDGKVNEDDAIYLLQHVMMPGLFPLA